MRILSLRGISFFYYKACSSHLSKRKAICKPADFSAETDAGVCAYLLPLSYGIPSAFGALDFFEVNTRTTIVAT